VILLIDELTMGYPSSGWWKWTCIALKRFGECETHTGNQLQSRYISGLNVCITGEAPGIAGISGRYASNREEVDGHGGLAIHWPAYWNSGVVLF
jgi:hypothetical protein